MRTAIIRGSETRYFISRSKIHKRHPVVSHIGLLCCTINTNRIGNNNVFSLMGTSHKCL